MKKIAIIIAAVLTVLALGFGIYTRNVTDSIENSESRTQIGEHDGIYIINGTSVTLVNGVSEVEAAPGSATKVITRYFGNEVRHDFNGDGREDSVFLVTQEMGGSGTFFYVVARLDTANGPIGSHGVLLGDRIAPQSTSMGKGTIVVVNYAERKSGESFTTQPSVGKSIWLLLDTATMQFGEVAQNFEGEADPARMTLTMKPWTWERTIYNNDTEIIPRANKKFVLTFTDGKRFSASTDCNGVGGEYAVDGNKIAFTRMMSTLMYCENSQEGDFSKMLSEAQSYLFTSKGELILELPYDTGSVIFR